MGLIYIFAIKLKWFPTSGFGSASFRGTPWQEFCNKAQISCHACGGNVTGQYSHRDALYAFQHGGNIEPGLYQDRQGKGLAEKAVIYKHALKNSLIPVITCSVCLSPTCSAALYHGKGIRVAGHGPVGR